MRDLKRIDRILDTLKNVWEEYPDLRLGQILSNAVLRASIDLFYIEDDELENFLVKFYSKEKCDDMKEDNDTFVTGLTTSETSTYHNDYDLPAGISTSTSCAETTTITNEAKDLCPNIAKCSVTYYNKLSDDYAMDCCLIPGLSVQDITEKIYDFYSDYNIVGVEVSFLDRCEGQPVYIEEELFDIL